MRVSALSPQLIGILSMSAAGAVFSGHDAITKHLAATYPISELIFVRQIVSLIVLAVFIHFTQGLGVVRTSTIRLHSWRASLFVVSTVLIAISVSVLPLPTALAIVFASPLVVAALSATMLGEPVGPRRWAAIIVGFIGVLVIIRPGGASFTWLLLIPVAAASASALRDIVTRILHRTDNTNAILFWSNIAIIVAMAAFYPLGQLDVGEKFPHAGAWKEIATGDVGFFVAGGVLNILAHFLTITALRFGDAALVTPFRYTALVWAALLGYMIWGHVPDEWTVLGAAIVVLAGVYLVLRGAEVKKKTVSAPQS